MYAAAHPERVAGVIYADATGDMTGSDQEWNGWLDTLRQDKHAVLRKMWEPVLETASADVKHAVYFSGDRTSTEVFVGALAGVREVNVARAVASYKGPVFAIVATESPYSLHVQNRAIPTRRMTGAGHWLMMEKPAEFNAILDEFLARIDYAEGVRAFLFPFSTTSGERVARS
jgi:pimeloyl-ACP methyl ester carboxylesterase